MATHDIPFSSSSAPSPDRHYFNFPALSETAFQPPQLPFDPFHHFSQRIYSLRHPEAQCQQNEVAINTLEPLPDRCLHLSALGKDLNDQLLSPPDSCSSQTFDMHQRNVSGASTSFQPLSLDPSTEPLDLLDSNHSPAALMPPFSFATFPVSRASSDSSWTPGPYEYSPVDPSSGGHIPELIAQSEVHRWSRSAMELWALQEQEEFATIEPERFSPIDHQQSSLATPPNDCQYTSNLQSPLAPPFHLDSPAAAKAPTPSSAPSPFRSVSMDYHITPSATSPLQLEAPGDFSACPSSIYGDLSAVIDLLGESRTRQLAAHDLTLRNMKVRRRAPPEDDKPGKSSSAKSMIDQEFSCTQCGTTIGRVLLRGKRVDLDAKYTLSYLCLACTSSPGDSSGSIEERYPAVYADSLSAIVDASQERIEFPVDKRPLPPKIRGGTMAGQKRKVEEVQLCCDVCSRPIAVGGVISANHRNPVEFAIESVCATCSERYSRCTDCGGGGGGRLGIGRWRCKELFCEGRKTCQLSHLRLGNLADMIYDIHPIDTLPSHELTPLIEACSSLYRTTVLSVLATPEILEPIVALAQTYEQAEKLMMDSWGMVEPLFKEHGTAEVKRYIALRWSTLTPRKRTKAHTKCEKKRGVELAKETEDMEGVMRPGKDLSGFVMAEVDLLTGSLLLSLTTPWATGETFDATTLLMQALVARVEGDIALLNAGRRQANVPPYPSLNKAWTMTFFQPDSRLVHHLQNRRNFLPLTEYLSKHPECERTDVAPLRPTFLPREYMQGWTVLVRKIVPDDDWNARPPPKVSEAYQAKAKVAKTSKKTTPKKRQ